MTQVVRVDRARLVQLIQSFTYSVGSSAFSPPGVDKYHRETFSEVIDGVVAIAEEIGFDIWSEMAAPFGTEDETPIAVILRRVNIRHGAAGRCEVYRCRQLIAPLRRRPRTLPRGTRWPSCPELCFLHAQLRNAILLERVIQWMPDHDGPVSAGSMPLPQFAHLAPEPWMLREHNIVS